MAHADRLKAREIAELRRLMEMPEDAITPQTTERGLELAKRYPEYYQCFIDELDNEPGNQAADTAAIVAGQVIPDQAIAEPSGP